MFSVSGELISETRSIIIAHRFRTIRTFRPFRDILDKLPVLRHLEQKEKRLLCFQSQPLILLFPL